MSGRSAVIVSNTASHRAMFRPLRSKAASLVFGGQGWRHNSRPTCPPAPSKRTFIAEPHYSCREWVTPKMDRRLAQPRLVPVLLGQQRSIARHRPVDRQVVIIPGKPEIVFARIIAVCLVDDLSIRLERTEPVRKPFRQKKLITLRCAQD